MWHQITETEFFDALGAVPPALRWNDGFLQGEAIDHCPTTGRQRFTAFHQVAGNYFRAREPMTRDQFKAVDISSIGKAV